MASGLGNHTTVADNIHFERCESCHLKDLPCNRQRPCGTCLRERSSEQGATCVYPARCAEPRSHSSSESDIRERVRKLERQIGKLKGRVSLSNDPTEPNSEEGASAKWPKSNAIESRYNDIPQTVLNDLMLLISRGEGAESQEPESTKIYEAVEAPSHMNLDGAFILGYRALDFPLQQLYPLPQQITAIWQAYQENVDPLLKITHGPTTEKLMYEREDEGKKSLFFAICYAAVVSMEDTKVQKYWGLRKTSIIAAYRFAVDQALLQARFFDSSNILVLQALVLYLNVVKRYEGSGFCWSLMGLAVQNARRLKLQRDGMHLGLSPFDIEMRRRLWWAICILDLRYAGELGADLIICPGSFDTQLPSNLNDSDLETGTKDVPTPQKGYTDSTIPRIRYELCSLWRRLYAIDSTTEKMGSSDTDLTIADWESTLMEAHNRLEAELVDCFLLSQEPLLSMVATVSRFSIAYMVFAIHQAKGEDEADTSGTRDSLLSIAIEILECHQKTRTNPKYQQWSWIFHVHMQWSAVTYVLASIARRPWTEMSERAWKAIVQIMASTHGEESQAGIASDIMSIPLPNLFKCAEKHRAAEIARQSADIDSSGKRRSST